jgi:hypothetical protein
VLRFQRDLTLGSQIRDAFPFERSCLDLTVVDPRSRDPATLTTVGVVHKITNNKRAPPMGF